MIGLVAYYLISPFNILFYFAETETMPFFILLITLLKTGSAGLTMFYYLKKTKKYKIALIGSLLYSLMSYNIVYQQNIMWLDGIIYLPLIILGLDRIIDGNKSFMYLFFLFLSIITNYYIAFMICIFSVVYFAVKLIEKNWQGTLKIFIKKSMISIKYFIIESLLAAALGAVLLGPLLFSFLGGASEGKLVLDNLFTLDNNFEFYDLFSKIYIG